jgi:hypothetical protein
MGRYVSWFTVGFVVGLVVGVPMFFPTIIAIAWIMPTFCNCPAICRPADFYQSSFSFTQSGFSLPGPAFGSHAGDIPN